MSGNWVTVHARRILRRLRRREPTFQLADPDAVTVGRHTRFGRGTVVKTWARSERIRIGAFCSVAEDVRILHPGVNETLYDERGLPTRLHLRGNHRFHAATTFPIGTLLPRARFDEVPADGSLQSHPLVIGNDVWIGYRAMILGAVTVGDGAVIAAGAVVLTDVPPYTLVAGNPARVIRHRFSQPTVEALERLAWWEWTDQQIIDQAEWLMRPVTEFLDHVAGHPAPPHGPAS